ncbi:efflux RND transporter periplasmic adaptor subunit [Paraflavisolibacter sp. H34]|uniref:efflux RND transporter periplasmic adaptor subunit n=1 Tax=Huijunlia imazamoxiresistens TaxID=3127457 RepID=UPI00301A01E6
MNKAVKWGLIGLGGLTVLLAAGRLANRPGSKGVKVTVEQAASRTIVETVNASGKIYPEVEVKVSSDVSGEIVELTVAEGDSVKRGQVLARIYADIYASQRDEASTRVTQTQATVANSQAALDALKAQLEQDRLAYNRNKELFAGKVISRAELEQYETKFKTSQAQYSAALQNIRSLDAAVQSARTGLQMADKTLGRTTITAPMNGIVSMLSVKKGERVVGTAQMAGTEMMRVANMGAMEVRVDVGENDIVKVNIGDSADVEVDAYNNRKFRGVVTQIASSTNKTGNTATTSNDVTSYEVHIRLLPADYQDLLDPARPRKFPFRPGMNASADIRTRTKPGVIAVPITAVAARDKDEEEGGEEAAAKKGGEESSSVEEALQEVVFLLKEGDKVEKRVVTTGIQDRNHIEIVAGLKAGEQVITAPYTAISKDLKTGTKVTVVPRDKLFEKE